MLKSKLLKTTAITCSLLLGITMLGGCGKKNKRQWIVDTKKLVKTLEKKDIFDTTLEKADAETASMMLEVEKGTKITLYMGGDGSKADELLVLKGKDENDTELNEESAEMHVEEVAASFANYIPEETAKAEDAVIVTKGRYVILCISTDPDTAEKVIKDSFEEGIDNEEDEEAEEDDPGEEPEEQGTAQMTNETMMQSHLKPESEYAVLTSNETVQTFQNYGYVAIGAQGYEMYYCDDIGAQSYAQLINKVADSVDGVAQVYDMVACSGAGIIFPDNLKDKDKSSNQKEVQEMIRSKLSSKVRFVNTYPYLMSHRDEYLFYRTDHHWTARGAYYGYQAFCDQKGIQCNPLEGYRTDSFPGLLGTLYRHCEYLPAMEANPDNVEVWYPLSFDSLTFTVQDQNGEEYNTKVIADPVNISALDKYMAFIAGNNPYSVIRNSTITDGSSCVVIKESFANCLIPYLSDHYQTVHIIDYRYWKGDIATFVKENSIGDVIFINNCGMVGSKQLKGNLASIIN